MNNILKVFFSFTLAAALYGCSNTSGDGTEQAAEKDIGQNAAQKVEQTLSAYVSSEMSDASTSLPVITISLKENDEEFFLYQGNIAGKLSIAESAQQSFSWQDSDQEVKEVASSVTYSFDAEAQEDGTVNLNGSFTIKDSNGNLDIPEYSLTVAPGEQKEIFTAIYAPDTQQWQINKK